MYTLNITRLKKGLNMTAKANPANAYGKVLLNSLNSPKISEADKAIVGYKLGLVSRFEAKLAYTKYKEIENKLFNLAMGAF